MRILIFLPLFPLLLAAPHSFGDDDLPFSTDNFPTFLDEENTSSAEQKYELALNLSEKVENPKKEQNTNSVFNKNGPPSIGVDLFSNAAIEENIRKLSYEGSGTSVEENLEKSGEVTLTPVTKPDDLPYSAENSTLEDAIVEASSNSSILHDQNTSDGEVDAISDTIYQKNEAVVQSSQSENTQNKGDVEITSTTKSTTVLQEIDYSGNQTKVKESKPFCPPPQICKKNCFIAIDEYGCQGCQCLWIAADCEINADCPDRNQYCDLGKCNCQPGYLQNMKQSGTCQADPNLQNRGLTFTERADNTDLDLNEVSKSLQELTRHKRELKPRRSERLEWPGRLELW